MFRVIYITTGPKGDCNNYQNVEGEVKFNGKDNRAVSFAFSSYCQSLWQLSYSRVPIP